VPDPNPGAGAEHGQAGAYDWLQPGAQSGTESHAEEIAKPGGTTSVRTTKNFSGTGVWSAEATAWDAPIPHPRTGQSGGGVRPGSLAYNLTRLFAGKLAL
jgi:hypothetical protein